MTAPTARRANRVLLVEDDAKLALLLQRWLHASGWEVISAGSGDAALVAASTHAFDAVVVDIMIPHPDGLEVCRHLRGHGYQRPIIAITARADERDHALAAGADDLLTKPFQLSVLTARLTALAVGFREPAAAAP